MKEMDLVFLATRGIAAPALQENHHAPDHSYLRQLT